MEGLDYKCSYFSKVVKWLDVNIKWEFYLEKKGLMKSNKNQSLVLPNK